MVILERELANELARHPLGGALAAAIPGSQLWRVIVLTGPVGTHGESKRVSMIRIVDGKRYDTETATELHSVVRDWDGYFPLKEALFRTPHGRLFIAKWFTHDTDPVAVGWHDAGDWLFPEENSRTLKEWLERTNAPGEVYLATGFEVAEG